ncbi:TonB-dependent receptor [Sporomusa termitida]|uniref:Vitamin B12 transporter BtuB n=1 Tax=Sporomusa termitida TaxID=2377 RepID=A0A517DR88_9FIRM|nr:TonB-dependent receptor [Sporomusa termitida]QDR79871.1 Vitamin B12 transporter BtuB [Sporomusa termitida]
MYKRLSKMVIPPAVCVCLLSSFNPVMAEEAVALDEVEVRSTALSDYLVTTAVITADKIKEMGATNLAEAIEGVPGLYVARADKGSRLARIRGAASDQTKVYIDGMPVFPLSGIASNSASNLETIPIDNIEKIEIIKGPGPVQYGTDYKGGIVLITTKDGKGAGQINLHLSAGSHSTYNTYATYSGSEGTTSYYLAAGKKQTDGHLNNSDTDSDYFNGKIKWQLNENSNLTLSGYYMNTDREIPNDIDQLTGREVPSTITWSGDTPVDGKTKVTDWKYTDFKQSNIALQFDQKASDRFAYNVKVYHVTDENDLWVHNGNNADNPAFVTPASPVWYRSGWYSKGNGMEFAGDLQADRNNTVTFGVKYNKIDWDTDENNSDLDEGGTDKRLGYYIQDNWRIDNKTNFTLGVRYDEAKQSYSYAKTDTEGNFKSERNSSKVDATDPVLNITHQLDAQNTVRFSAGKSHIFVTAKQVASNLAKGVALPETEKATNYEIGWKHDFDEKASLDVAAFTNKIDNRIDRRTSDKTYYNIAETDIKGIELEYTRQLTDRVKGFLNYTYLDAKDTNEAGVKTKAVNLPSSLFNYGLTYTVDKFQATVLGQAFGKSDTDHKTYKKLAGYHTLDVELKYRENDNLGYFLRVNNILDSDYWEKATYPADGINFATGVTLRM